ncbi:MAG: hypothetical protein JRI68_19260 [Deltaproteobacteria bacterium]|nr:hypothetical protein [Deltaproteobacteria bacterium]
MVARPRCFALPIALTVLLAGAVSSARPAGLKANFAPERVVIDGLPKEFGGRWRKLDYDVKGEAPDGDDLKVNATIAYDDRHLYVAAEVQDDKLVGGGDHLELLLGIPGGKVHSLKLYPGVPGKSRAQVKSGWRTVRGAQIVEAPAQGGYTLEAKIPWAAIPRSSTVRVGYRGALFAHDADKSRAIESVVGTADTRSYASLPPISIECEIALGAGLLRKQNITEPPRHNLMANLVGDKLQERVLVYDRFLVILGPGYRDGHQYYFRDLGKIDHDRGLPRFEVKDFTGDGMADVLLRKRVKGSKGSVEVVEILSYHGEDETPASVFAQEVKLDLDSGSITNELTLRGKGSRTKIVLKPGRAKGIDPKHFRRQSNTGATAVLTPWGTIASQTYQVRGGKFVLTNEKTKAPDRPPPPKPTAHQPEPPPPSTNTGGSGESNMERVYGLYKKQRKVRGRARFDMRANLVGNKAIERLVVHNRDLVVFGDGYRGGRGFAAVTLAQFEKSRDIKSVTTRDVTGDGRHEIVVRGELRAPMPEDLGPGEMHRTVVMVYKVKGNHFDRVFAAEIGRRIENRRIEAKIRFKKSGRYRIELKPGRAKGYTERTYPWLQKEVPTDDFEPLLLPWGGIDRVRLRYDGSVFVRK